MARKTCDLDENFDTRKSNDEVLLCIENSTRIEEFIEFVEFLFKKCKEHLCLYIHQAAHTVEWTYLSKESQKEIMEEANYVFIENPNKGRMARPQLTSMQREFIEFVEFLFKKCKEHLCLYIHQAAHTVEWTYLSKESQKEIMEEANYVFIENPNKGRMARPQLTSMQRKVTGASGLSLKEYFDQHFGVKTLDKKSKSPSPANHISSTKTQTKSKSNLPTSGAKKSKIVTEMEKTTSRPTAAKPSISKGGNSDTKKKSGGTSTVKLKQKEATHLAGAASGKMKGKTDAKSENSRTVEHKSTENLQQICVDHEVDNEMNDNDADNQPTSESAGYTLHYLQQALGIEREPFVPQFGHSRLQGADGVVNDRQGWTIVVQRPAQILNVEFTMPEL